MAVAEGFEPYSATWSVTRSCQRMYETYTAIQLRVGEDAAVDT